LFVLPLVRAAACSRCRLLALCRLFTVRLQALFVNIGGTLARYSRPSEMTPDILYGTLTCDTEFLFCFDVNARIYACCLQIFERRLHPLHARRALSSGPAGELQRG
jgi:hypothetical protein